jgi:hypothetical protein
MPKKRMAEDVAREILQEKGSAGVNAMLAARGGMGRADLISDRDRGPTSSLGHGTRSKPKKKEKK